MKRLILAILLLACPAQAIAERATVAGPVGPDGTEVVCDLPLSQQLENSVGTDRSGLCVFTSINMAGNWANVTALRDFQKKMRREQGGGWPEKVTAMMAKYAPGVRYVQYTGSDPAILDLSMRTGRMVSVTYGYSERYGQRIDHMVNLVHLDEKWAAILDNNFIGKNQLEWMPRAEFLRRWRMGGGGWAVILLDPGPPPIPVNSSRPVAVASAWGPQGCDPVGSNVMRRQSLLPSEPTIRAPNIQSLGDGYSWRTRGDDPGRLYLYRGDNQLGGWDATEQEWRPYDEKGQQWGAAGTPPWLPSMVRPTGVNRDRMASGEHIWVNGEKVAGGNVRELFANDALVDDSAKMRLTVVAKPEVAATIREDLKSHPALSQIASRYAVQFLEPGNWAADVFKLDPATNVYISIQGAPDKRQRAVEYFAHKSYPGADALAAGMIEAVRRADPNYDPSKTPDMKPTPAPVNPVGPAPAPASEDASWIVWAIGLGLLALVFLRGPRHDAD